MTTQTDWNGRVGQTWATEWRRTDRSLADLAHHLDAAIRASASDRPIRALDIGCGAGATSLTLATSRPDADIIGVDVSSELLAAAARRGAGLANLTFREGDAVAVALDCAPVDLFVSRHGVMFFADPVAAFTLLHDAAAPHARLVFSCFRNRADNVWASDLIAEVTNTTPTPVQSYAPGPFGFADPTFTMGLLTDAGWTVDRPDRIDFTYIVGEGADPIADAADFFHRIGPLASILREAADSDGLDARLKAVLERYRTGTTVAFPASAWIWRAHA